MMAARLSSLNLSEIYYRKQPCSSNQDRLKITIVTDNYGSETSWELKNSDNSVFRSGPGSAYGNNQGYTVIDECVPKNVCTFNIKDSYGDGICCSYGSGSYTIEKNGVVIKEGGQFTSSEAVAMCTASPATPTSAPTVGPTRSPTAGPTKAPVASPTVGPTRSPTEGPTSAPIGTPTVGPTRAPNVEPTAGPTSAPVEACPGQAEITIEIQTDDYPGETTYTLSNSGTVKSGGPFSTANKLYTETFCAPVDACTFKINDSYGDGICCGVSSSKWKERCLVCFSIFYGLECESHITLLCQLCHVY